MSNTVITNYTDLNGPSTKADSSVVVIVNKDGSLSVDQNLLGTLMGTDGSQAAGISVVRVGHEGRPDDATDSESEDDKVPHVTLSVDSYYDEPNSIIKYDSGAEMLQSLRIETRENSLIGFQNDHCYTPFTSPSQTLPQTNENYTTYDEPVIEITHTPPPKPVPSSKKITILEQQIIPKGKKIVINQQESPVILKANDVLNKPLPVLPKSKKNDEKKSDSIQKSDDTTESSSISSGDSIPDRDSDSDYKDTKDRSGSLKVKKPKLKPRILKSSKSGKLDAKVATRLKSNKNILKKEVKEKAFNKNVDKKQSNVDVESMIPVSEIPTVTPVVSEHSKTVIKPVQKPVKKEKKTPAHVTALLSDMTSLFSSPDVIRRVSTDNKAPLKPDAKETFTSDKKVSSLLKSQEISNVVKASNNMKSVLHDNIEKSKNSTISPKTYIKQKEKISSDKVTKGFELTATIPQLDEACLAQILQDTSGITSNPVKIQPTISTVNHMNSPGLTGPLSPTLDLLGGLQPEEEGLTEDLLMHVAQLVESSENLQEVIDKQVLGKVDSTQIKSQIQPAYQQTPGNSLYAQTPKSTQKFTTRKDPIEIVRRDGRVITLPPIEAPATRSSKRKIQMESGNTAEVISSPLPIPTQPTAVTPEPQVLAVSKQYTNKKLPSKKQELAIATSVVDKSAESQESWNSEDDPYRLWCICRQPHNNRFMICCDGCEDWFHGKCVNITKAMGQQMEEQGIEWRCPNCIKKAKGSPKILKASPAQKKIESDTVSTPQLVTKEATSKTNCIVCKKSARASSIYCSDACILKHAQDSLGSPTPNKSEAESGKTSDKQKSDSRVIVYERKSGRLLAGPNAPTAENLKSWLQKNPTFEVVRPGALSTIKPNVPTKKKSLNEPNKIQTTLSFEKIPRKSTEQPTSSKTITSEVKPKTQPQDGKMLKTPPVSKAKLMPEVKMKQSQLPELKIKNQPEKTIKVLQSPKEEKIMPQPKTPISTRANPLQYPDSPKPSTSTPRGVNESRKLIRSANRTPSTYEKAPSVSPSPSRRKDSQDTHRNKMDSSESIRDNVRKALQEQLSQRMAETKSSKFTESEIRQFSIDTEIELHELFRDVGMKYKAKYRSLMFNIKDRKNLSLWQKICERSITPKQLVRLSPEELASQELAQWRDKEVKHQLELIKKSELDMLAASKTYVLKTHKGEEVMETKESVSTELDPNVPVEDLVTALNDSAVGEENKDVNIEELNSKSNKIEKKHGSSRKRTREDSSSTYSKKERRDSKRDTESRKSRSSRRKSEIKEKESKEERSSRRQSRKSSRVKSVSRERSREASKEKTREHSRYRSRSRAKSKRRSKSREHSRSTSHSRDRSHSRSRRRSTSADKSKSKKRSRSKVRSSTEDKHKHRSRSQDNAYNNKNKNDSTDSDSIERPKSAMLKEVHPEYDPHEPMITSAFSEEDLRKSREDVFEDNKIEIGEYGNSDYDASKSFIIDPNIIPSPKYVENQDKSAAEPESDQEPSSTVDNSAAIIWNGCINMVDVARFYVAAHEVSGSASDLEEDLSPELDIVGRINPETVWDYINKMKRAGNKDIVVLRLQAANDEEKMQYIALYSYLSSRNRLGVVKVSNTTSVKDFYIVPLPANTALPSVLTPLDGPGLGEVKTHLLIAIVIRQRKKRMPPHIPKDIIPEKVARLSRKRSYTPPTGAVVSNIAASNIAASNKATYTPPMSPRRRALPLPAYTSPALSTSVKDKIAASLAAADEDEAYSPGSSSSGGSVQTASTQPASNTLRSKMEELNRQIEEQKQQILKMAQADSSAGAEDEAYSPSRPMTPPPVVPLADIALPSNLQEILATIKQRSEPTPDVDMRGLPLPP